MQEIITRTTEETRRKEFSNGFNHSLGKTGGCESCIKSDVCRLMKISRSAKKEAEETLSDMLDEVWNDPEYDEQDLKNFNFHVVMECKRWAPRM